MSGVVQIENYRVSPPELAAKQDIDAPARAFIGSGLKRTRLARKMSIAAFARQIGLSSSYLGQLENNRRPAGEKLFQRLYQRLGILPSDLISEEEAELRDRLNALLAEHESHAGVKPSDDVDALIAFAPTLSQNLSEIFQSQKQEYARLSEMAEAADGEAKFAPWQEAERAFSREGPYFEVLEEHSAKLAQAGNNAQGLWRVAISLLGHHGVEVQEAANAYSRRFDKEAGKLILPGGINREAALFQLLAGVAEQIWPNLLLPEPLKAKLSPLAGKVYAGLSAGYLARAALMPYARFHAAALSSRFDLDKLAHRFGTSFDHVAERLVSLQKKGSEAVPFFLYRSDAAGQIFVSRSAKGAPHIEPTTRCPLWLHYRAPSLAGAVSVEQAKLPDDTECLMIAREVAPTKIGYQAEERRSILVLGCESRFSDDIVYQPDMGSAAPKLGHSCRYCPRRECVSRLGPADPALFGNGRG